MCRDFRDFFHAFRRNNSLEIVDIKDRYASNALTSEPRSMIASRVYVHYPPARIKLRLHVRTRNLCIGPGYV